MWFVGHALVVATKHTRRACKSQ